MFPGVLVYEIVETCVCFFFVFFLVLLSELASECCTGIVIVNERNVQITSWAVSVDDGFGCFEIHHEIHPVSVCRGADSGGGACEGFIDGRA